MANKNNNKQKDKLVQTFEDQIKKVDVALESMKKSCMELQVGDGKTPYWNGSNACSMIKNALTQYETDKSLLHYIEECGKAIKK